MNAHLRSFSFDEDGRNGLRRAAMFRSGAAVGVLLLMLTMATTSCYVKPPTATVPTTTAPQGESPYEQRGATRNDESTEWVQGTQG
jgi:hypothetical protein